MYYDITTDTLRYCNIGARLFQYEKLTVESFGTSGTGTFTLNSNISGTWGTDYHVYILAEDVNGEKETDYASAPVEIKAITASAADYEGTYDGQAHGISVSITDPTSGAIVKYGESADSCTSETCPTITNVNDSPKIVYYQIEAEGYLTAKGSAVVTINKAEPTVTPPTAKNLTYTGNEQELVTAGSTDFGTLLYSLDGEPYSETIPKGTDAGTYTVCYKVESGDNWNAVEPQTVEITIKKATAVINTISKVDTDGNQIDGNIEGTGSYPIGSKVTFTAPKVEGYNFVGWYQYSDASPYYTGEKLGSAHT